MFQRRGPLNTETPCSRNCTPIRKLVPEVRKTSSVIPEHRKKSIHALHRTFSLQRACTDVAQPALARVSSYISSSSAATLRHATVEIVHHLG